MKAVTYHVIGRRSTRGECHATIAWNMPVAVRNAGFCVGRRVAIANIIDIASIAGFDGAAGGSDNDFADCAGYVTPTAR